MNDVFEYNPEPQYYDFDPSQIVHNVTYIRWLEDTRAAFQRQTEWPPERLYAEDLVPALTRTEILYRIPINLGEPVVIRLWITRIGRSAWGLLMHFVHPETNAVYAVAEQTGCFVRKSTHRPIAMPADYVAACREYRERTGLPASE